MAKRRGSGEGSIQQRAEDGLWVGVVSLGFVGGKRKRKAVYGATKAEVQTKLRELQNRAASGTPDPTKLTVGQYIEQYLARIRPDAMDRLDAGGSLEAIPNTEGQLSPTTFVSYRSILTKDVFPHLGTVPLAKLSPAHIRAWYDALKTAKRPSRTKHLANAVLRRVLNLAVGDELIIRNPIVNMEDQPQHTKAKQAALTGEEALRLVEAMRVHRMGALFLLALDMGARSGELLGLKTENVNLTEGWVDVKEQLIEIQGVFLGTKPPKSDAGVRRVYIAEDTRLALVRYRARIMADGLAGAKWFFPNEQGGPFRKSNVRKEYLGVLAMAGVPLITFHGLRHTMITLLVQSGKVDLKTVQERAGHSTIAQTLEYTHSSDQTRQSAGSVMQEILGGTK